MGHRLALPPCNTPPLHLRKQYSRLLCSSPFVSQDKRDFITKMEEKLQKRRRDLEEARKQQLRDQLGVGDPATIRERMAKENAFLRECLVERLRTQDVRTDPEAIAEYIRCEEPRMFGRGYADMRIRMRISAADGTTPPLGRREPLESRLRAEAPAASCGCEALRAE